MKIRCFLNSDVGYIILFGYRTSSKSVMDASPLSLRRNYPSPVGMMPSGGGDLLITSGPLCTPRHGLAGVLFRLRERFGFSAENPYI